MIPKKIKELSHHRVIYEEGRKQAIEEVEKKIDERNILLEDTIEFLDSRAKNEKIKFGIRERIKELEELTYKRRFEDLQDRMKSPLDELMSGRLVLEYEKKDKIKKLEKELEELRKFKENFGKNDFEKSIKVLLEMFENIIKQNKKLELTEKNRIILLKENRKLKQKLPGCSNDN